MNTYFQLLSQSNDTTKNLIIPLCSASLNFGQYIFLEGSSDPLAHALDTKAGCDVIRVGSDGCQGIAVRNQYGVNHRSFTLRVSLPSGAQTEVTKRSRDQHNGNIFPRYTIQSYITQHAVFSAIIETSDLLDYYNERKHFLPIQQTASGETFVIIGWDYISQEKPVVFLSHSLSTINGSR